MPNALAKMQMFRGWETGRLARRLARGAIGPVLVLLSSPAHAAEPNVLLGHRACPGYTMANYNSQRHPAPGPHGIRLGIGCRTAFTQYETYSRNPNGPAGEAAYRAFLATAKMVTDYHAQNRFGSDSPGGAPAPAESADAAAPSAAAQAAAVQETQRRALGRNLQKHHGLPLTISDANAREVLRYFFGSVPASLDQNDRRFAQSLILETAEMSTRVGYIESLFRSAISPRAKPSSVVKAIARALVRDLGKPDTLQAALDSPHYLIVVHQVTANWRSVWNERMQNDDSSLLTGL